jgi:predicted ATPase/DNA-binding XRE family transcriptional regulator
MPDTDLGRQLRAARAAAGLTQEELAERARVSARTVSDVERGLRDSIYAHTAAQLADALDISGEQRSSFLTTARGSRRRPTLWLAENGAVGQRGDGRAIATAGTLLGRERELELLQAWLRDPAMRMITITGPGGVGKTRLAEEIAATAGDVAEAVWFVPLADLGDAGLVPALTARAVGLPANDAVQDRLKAHLSGRRTLLVFDTFERVLDAAPMLADLVAACAQLTVMVTSRTALRLRGERELPLVPLAVPPTGAVESAGQLSRFAATALFVERASAVRPGWDPSDAEAAQVADISRRLDGLPLAIELAAARVKHLPVSTLSERLRDRLHILVGGPRDAPSRHRAMRDAIGWSYDLLESVDQRLFRGLSVFADWSLDAAEAVVSGVDPSIEVLGTLSRLVDHSLVVLREGTNGVPRYAMLDVVREFAAERLVAEGERQEWSRQHADHLIAVVEDAEPRLRSADQAMWYQRLEEELPNLRLALAWCIDAGEAERAVRLTAALWMFWRWYGGFAEGLGWLQRALRLEPRTQSDHRARALWGAGWLAYDRGGYLDTATAAAELINLAATTGNPAHRRNGLTLQGMVAMADANYPAAMAFFEHALAAARSAGSAWLIATSLLNLGVAAIHVGDVTRAEGLISEAAGSYSNLGDELFQLRATRYGAVCALLRGDPEQASRIFERCLGWSVQLGEKWGIAESLEGMCLISAALGGYDRAAVFAAAADGLREAIGARPHAFDAALTRRYLDDRRMNLAELTQLWETGRAMSLTELVALAEVPPTDKPRPDP